MSNIPPYQQPSGYSNYPREGFNSPDPFRRPPGVYFDSIEQGARLMWANLSTWVLSVLIVGGAYLIVWAIMEFIVITTVMIPRHPLPGGQPVSPQVVPGPAATLFLILIPVMIVIGCVFQVMLTGLMHMGVKQARNEPIAVGDMFAVLPRTGHILLASLLMGIAIAVGSLLCIVPGFYLQGLLLMLPLLVAETNLNAIQGLNLCIERLRPHAWGLFGLFFLAGLIGSIGAFACGVGLLFTYPIYFSIIGLTYNNFFPKQLANTVFNFPIGVDPPR